MADETGRKAIKTDTAMILLHLLTVILIIASFVLIRNYIDTRHQIADLDTKLELFMAQQQDYNRMAGGILTDTSRYLGQLAETESRTESPTNVFEDAEASDTIPADILSSVVSIYAGDDLGTGFVITANGNILTTYDLVKGTSRIEVDFFDGTITMASMISHDEDKNIAILKVAGKRLPYLEIKSSAGIAEDRPIRILHHPLGYGISINAGMITAIEDSHFTIDAAMNEGSIGGPVIDSDDRVIGIITSESTALSSDEILPLLDSLA